MLLTRNGMNKFSITTHWNCKHTHREMNKEQEARSKLIYCICVIRIFLTESVYVKFSNHLISHHITSCHFISSHWAIACGDHVCHRKNLIAWNCSHISFWLVQRIFNHHSFVHIPNFIITRLTSPVKCKVYSWFVKINDILFFNNDICSVWLVFKSRKRNRCLPVLSSPQLLIISLTLSIRQYLRLVQPDCSFARTHVWRFLLDFHK